MAKPKYRGNLSKPITPGIVTLAQHGSYENWLNSDQARQQLLSRLLELLDYYQIDPSTDDCWLHLSLALAGDHVRGLTFQRHYVGRGRPQKHKSKPKNRRGRHRIYTDADDKEFVRIIDGKKALIEQESDKKVTDTEVLRRLITSYAKANGKSIVRTLESDLSYYQKRLSKAKQKIPKNT